jgi:small subunit ribosomal protein S6
MPDYELMLVLRADLPEEALSAQLETVKNWIEGNQGKIEEIDRWGRRRLAYPINGERDGLYIVYSLKMPSSAPIEIERNLRIAENVLRYLITRKDD